MLRPSDLIRKQRECVIGHLKTESQGMVDPVLLHGIKYGIGFHNAALHPVERKAIEDAYRKGIILSLCCTSTLAAGVNLPAARVIIRQTSIAQLFLTCSRYMQMTGRAGRGCGDAHVRGGDANGSDSTVTPTRSEGVQPDSYTFVSANDVEKFEALLERHVESVTSRLQDQVKFFGSVTTAAVGGARPGASLDQPTFTGVARVVLEAVTAKQSEGAFLSDIIERYRLTLLYQTGVVSSSTSSPADLHEHGTAQTIERIRTLRPLLVELRVSAKRRNLPLLTPIPPSSPFSSRSLGPFCDFRRVCVSNFSER